MQQVDGSLYSWKREHTEIPDHTFPVNVFHIHFPDRMIIPPHWHEHMEWILVTQGSFQVQVGAVSRELAAGEAAWVNRRQMHAAYPTEHGSELYAVVFNEALLKGAQDSTEAQYIRPLLSEDVRLLAFYRKELPVTASLQACLERIFHTFAHRSIAFELRIKGELLAALGLVYPSAEHIARPQQRTGHPENGIDAMLVHLGGLFLEPITVEQAARICCLTPNYFCHLFKKTTGKTLVEYVHMLRIHEATRLLQLRRDSIQGVAEQAGFSNPTYFGRVFKQITGVTPSEYMKRFPRV